MLVAPTTHFVKFAQAILFRGAGLSVVWPQFAALALIGTILFSLSLARFRKTLGKMAEQDALPIRKKNSKKREKPRELFRG
jgi:ABC-2 type transport system permease protein